MDKIRLCYIIMIIFIIVIAGMCVSGVGKSDSPPPPVEETPCFDVEILKSNLETAQKYIKLLEYDLKVTSSLHAKRVTVAFYCPSAGGINGTANKTSVPGAKPKPGWTIAVSRDLIEQGFYGHRIDICDVVPAKFRGMHFSHDKMDTHDPYTGEPIVNRIDICVGSLDDIPKQGIYHDVLISKILDWEEKY